MRSDVKNIIPSDVSETAESPSPIREQFYIPRTRYYGSKKRVLSWITSTLAPLGYRTVLDAFGGTGLVSLTQKQIGKRVTYNDLFASSHFTAKAFLAEETISNNSRFSDFFDEVVPFRGFIADEFDGYFYKAEENKWLDGCVRALKNRCGQEHLELMHCLIQACLQKRPFNIYHRRNLNLRLNCKRNTNFGNWRTWERTFEELMLSALSELRKTTFKSKVPVEFLEPIDASELKSGYDLVYLDPPYITGRGSEVDYMDRYHFVEGMVNYESWKSRINETSSTKSIEKTASVLEWNSRHTFKNRLFDLVDRHRHSIVALSYVTNAYPEQEEIVKFFQNNFGKVIFTSKELNHALSKGKKSEYLVVGIPKI